MMTTSSSHHHQKGERRGKILLSSRRGNNTVVVEWFKQVDVKEVVKKKMLSKTFYDTHIYLLFIPEKYGNESTLLMLVYVKVD